MRKLKYVFGPVPSRRLGRSLGVSPIPQKTCNYTCVYCQLGRTDKMTNTRQEFFPLKDILAEFDYCLKDENNFDVISLVGEGEPTLYSRLGELLRELKFRTEKPVAVITNGALLCDPAVRMEIMEADIVLPSLDSFDEASWRRIDRPHGSLRYKDVYEGLVTFTQEFRGQIFLEIMLLDGINDDRESLRRFKAVLSRLRYDKLYINTPVRPPAEPEIAMSSPEAMRMASTVLGGIPIKMLAGGGFFSEIRDDYEAVLSIIGRHPMNQFEIMGFLASRKVKNPRALLDRLDCDPTVKPMEYKGYVTYRLKLGRERL